MKVYTLAPGEDWIVDRFVKEWSEDNADIVELDPYKADVIWLMADWCWTRFPAQFLASKKVLTTIHHIVPEKFGDAQRNEFVIRDAVTTAYHVPNEHTAAFIRPLTKKPIHVVPYWANQKIWKRTGDSAAFRTLHGVPQDAYIIGTFQRDTEGASIASGNYQPKLEKGPDLFADYVEFLADWHRNEPFYGYPSGPHVLLAGWRRQYLIKRLQAARVPFTYIELPSQETLNELYQCLDLYAVTARYEGGPQALTECGMLGVPVVSRPIGMAEQVLPPKAVADDLRDKQVRPCVPDVERLLLPQGYEPYRKLLEAL